MHFNVSTLQALTEPEEERAQEIIGRLLRQWSIPRSMGPKEASDYDFIQDHKPYFTLIFQLIGYTLVVSPNREEVVYIRSKEQDANMRKFNKRSSIVILRLRQHYQNAQRTVSRTLDVDIRAEDLLILVNSLIKTPMEIPELQNILTQLQGYNLVLVRAKKKKDFCADTNVTIMPSILGILAEATVQSIDQLLQAYHVESIRRNTVEEEEVFNNGASD